ncbi:plus-3-domain-containing protein [Auriculariales sp. MPI-PUGE-AT-0066]|nr:plus-3-domain-containing protein [Auriculariales sp. MPI-PUGE-AT-0066]
MSDFEDDLLALAESRGSKSKRGAIKRKKEDEDSDSGSAMDIESEEDEMPPSQYPLEGKYVDEKDRARLLELPELEREEILSSRLEEIQRWKDRVELKNMLKRQAGHAGNDDDHRRKQGSKIDHYKDARKAKAERKARKDHPTSSSSPSKSRARSYSDDDESDREAIRKPRKDQKLTIDDLTKIHLTRKKVVECYGKPWFKDYVVGAWVRYAINNSDGGQNVYRVCRINAVVETSHSYTFEGKRVNEMLELQHGNAKRPFPMDKISDSGFTDREFDRLVATHSQERVELPTLRDVEQKEEHLRTLANKLWTEADIQEHLAQKRAKLGAQLSSAQFAIQRGNLRSAIQLAEKRGDVNEINELKSKLQMLELDNAAHVESTKRERDEDEDIIAKVNKRNRLLNEEAVKKNEAAEAERKRRDRLAKSSKNSTPRGTPGPPRSTMGASASPLPVAPIPPSGASYEAVVKDIEVDLGDF